LLLVACVFVSDNMAFSGSRGAVVLKKRHTSRLDLARVVTAELDSYLEKAGAFGLDIDRMKNHDLTDGQAKELIYDAFANHEVLPLRMLPRVGRLYFEDEVQRARFQDRDLWALNNAFTEAVKELKTVPQQNCGLEIGQFFGRIIHREGRPLEPVQGDIEINPTADDGHTKDGF
jgi:hypothetical protein